LQIQVIFAKPFFAFTHMASSSSQQGTQSSASQAVGAALPVELLRGRVGNPQDVNYSISEVVYQQDVTKGPLKKSRLPRRLDVWIQQDQDRFPIEFTYYKSGVNRDTWIPADTSRGPWLLKGQYVAALAPEDLSSSLLSGITKTTFFAKELLRGDAF
jgi:hypothetical protein